MCGIVGVVSLKPLTNWQANKEWMNLALFVDTIRGADSTGMFYVPNETGKIGDAHIYKRSLAGPEYLQLNRTKSILMDVDKYFCIVGHNRKATIGRAIDDYAHPFQYGHITLVHNGTLLSEKGLDSDHVVDSARICETLAKIEPGKEREVLELLDGSYTLIWYNSLDGTLHMARNAERPLWYAMTEDNMTMYFSSLPWVINELLSTTVKIKKVMSLKEGLHVKFDNKMSDLNQHISEKFTPYVAPPQKYKQHMGFYDNQSYYATTPFYRGDIIEFRCDVFTPYPDDPAHGHITGRTKFNGIEYDVVGHYMNSIPGLKPRKYKNRIFVSKYSYGSRISGMLELTVTDVIPRTESTEQKHLSLVESSTPKTQEIVSLIGPNGRLVSESEFVKLTQDGCANCTGNIDVGAHTTLRWLQDGRPLCKDCQDLFNQDGGVAKLN